MADDARALLEGSDMFQGLTAEELDAVFALHEVAHFAEDEVILEEDQQGRSCFIILEGRVDIEVRAAYGGAGRDRPSKLATLKRGETVGELSLVDGFLRSATARAVDPVQALAFGNDKLRALMEANPRIGFRVMANVASVLAGRMRSTNMKLRNALSDIFYY